MNGNPQNLQNKNLNNSPNNQITNANNKDTNEGHQESHGIVEEVKKKTFTNVQGYALHEILGKGSFGQVYKATKGGKVFAIKMIDKPLIRKKNLQKYVNNEVKVMRDLKNPNTVRLFEAFEDKDVLYLVMECCNQGTLFNYILKNKPEENECIRIFAQIMRGFIEIHEKHILHRDLKPSNIFIKDGIFKIADFGLAKPKAIGSSYCGTSYFMAPEILMKKVHDYKVDLWSMGVILFFMLFREYPFKNSAKLLEEITIKTNPIFEISKCLKHPKPLPLCSDGAVLLFQRIFVIDPIKRISFKELYDMEIFSDYFSVDELHHSSRIYQDLEKVPPKPGIEDHHGEDDEDHHHHNIHHSSNHHYTHHPREELLPHSRSSKFKPPVSPTSQQIELLPLVKPTHGGMNGSKNHNASQSTSQADSQKHSQNFKNDSKQNSLSFPDYSNEGKIPLPTHFQNNIPIQLSQAKSSSLNPQQHFQSWGFEDDNECYINEDESPKIVLQNIKIIKSHQSTTQIKFFGPKAFKGAHTIIPRPKDIRTGEDDTSIPKIPSSFLQNKISPNNLNNIAHMLENANYNLKLQQNQLDDIEVDIGEQDLEVVEKAYKQQMHQHTSSSSSSVDSSFIVPNDVKNEQLPNNQEHDKQQEDIELIQEGDDQIPKARQRNSSTQAIAFPEKEDVSNEANLRKLPFRKAPSLRMNMIDYAMKDKLRRQIIEECEEQFGDHVQIYLYEIGVYGILGDTIDSLNVLNLGSSTQSLVNYLLSKLLIFFAKKLLNSLQKTENIFNLKDFPKFVSNPSSMLLIGKIDRDIDQWSTKFTLFYYGIDQERDIQSEEVKKIVTEEITETDFDTQLKIPTRLVLDLIFKASYKMGKQCHSQLQASGILRTTLLILLSMLINNVFDRQRVKDYLCYYFNDPKNKNEKTLDFVNFNLWTAQASKEILLDQIHHLIKVVFGEKKLNILKTRI